MVSSFWSYPSDSEDYINVSGQISSYTPVKVAMDNNGNAILVWSQSDGTSKQIFKSEYRSSNWTHPSSLSDNISPSGTDATLPQASMDNNGNSIIVWSQKDEIAKMKIFMSEYRSQTWTHPSSVASHISPENYSGYSPQVAMDNLGNAIIAWKQMDDYNIKVVKSEYRNGSWNHPLDFTESLCPSNLYCYYPLISMSDNGEAIISWIGESVFFSNDYRMYKSEYRNGSWTNPTSNTSYFGPSDVKTNGAQMAMDNNGNIIIAWYGTYTSNNASVSYIYKSEYHLLNLF